MSYSPRRGFIISWKESMTVSEIRKLQTLRQADETAQKEARDARLRWMTSEYYAKCDHKYSEGDSAMQRQQYQSWCAVCGRTWDD